MNQSYLSAIEQRNRGSLFDNLADDHKIQTKHAMPILRVKERPLTVLLIKQAHIVLRWALFLYLSLVLCPIHYRVPTHLGYQWVDNTWMFALNYAAAHHLAIGRDIVFTWGPLSYLLFPFDVGNNLEHGLAFQAALWLLIVVILSDLFFRNAFQLRNLALFSILIGLFAFDYHQPAHPGEFLLPAALIQLVNFRLRGGMVRYVAALGTMGLVPLIHLSGAFAVAGVTAGLAVDRLLSDEPGARIEAALAAAVPPAVATAGLWLALGSFAAIGGYIRSGLELTRGYSAAMSWPGPRIELIVALEAVVLLAIAVMLMMLRQRERARFFALILVLPIALSVKHAFVRQEYFHLVQFFCFVAVALALVMLAVPLNERFINVGAVAITLLFALLWQDYVARNDLKAALAAITGIRTPSLVWNALHFDHLRRSLDAEGRENFPPDTRIEPEIKSIVGHEPVGFLSYAYSNAVIDDLNLILLPVVQSYSAYTPYLDQLNATFVDNKGPRFLIFDGKAVDGRHPWTESPATWAQVYRWYNTRMLGSHNLLLQRRAEPRFTHFEPVADRSVHFGEDLPMPASPHPVFWTMRCSLSRTGKLRALLARIPGVMMDVGEGGGRTKSFRVILPVLGAPSLGNYLPSSLDEFAEVLGKDDDPDFSVAKLEFRSLGKSAYQQDCEVEFLRSVP